MDRRDLIFRKRCRLCGELFPHGSAHACDEPDFLFEATACPWIALAWLAACMAAAVLLGVVAGLLGG